VKAWLRRSAPLFLLACASATIAACDETLEGGLGCGVLCPERPAVLEQDTIVGVALDSVLVGYPPFGTEGILVLAARGDTFDTRAIVRFDSLPTMWRRDNEVVDSTITDVDSAFIQVSLIANDTLAPSFTLEAYDVDTAGGDDTTRATLLPLFTPSRLLGTATFNPAELSDTIPIRVPIDTAVLNAKIHRDPEFLPRQLRVGLRLVSSTSTEIRIVSSNGGVSPQLVFRPTLDTSQADLSIPVFSKTPIESPAVAADFADFQLVVSTPPPEPAATLRIGGVPGRRGYMRFNIPKAIVDSSTIVRAQLLLTQKPNLSSPGATDTAAVQPYAISVGGAVTDLQRALHFLAAGFDTTRMTPADSGVRNFEIINVVRAWRLTNPERTPHAIALRTTTEGFSGWQVDFFSNEAPVSVRPRLVITYVPPAAPRVP
jgi:hypothetical protein